MPEYKKTKSASKVVRPRSQELEKTILNTMSLVSDIVGGTLGPGGHPVLIERSEEGLPSSITKDGVTVFRSLGFTNAEAHCIMEAARDCAVRTASEAGDGTTTATILAEALTRYTIQFCRKNPHVSPQVVIREIQSVLKKCIEPAISEISIKTDLESSEGRRLLRSVAIISANGDEDLADAVIKCFDITGDDGNVTIVESSGPPSNDAERIEGFPVPMGYEESCTKFYPSFINDVANQKIFLEKPCFIIYFGRLTEIQSVAMLLERLGSAWQANVIETHNVVIVATGFSESVLASLAVNFASPQTINVFPLLVPQSPLQNGQRHFLEDLSAVTGGTVFDPLTSPMDRAEFGQLGNLRHDEENDRWLPGGIQSFECGRFRSTILGYCNEDEVLLRADEVRAMVANAESELDRSLLQERLAKLTGGIAKLRVIGASNGELRERRDRAEDAVCAVRGALKHGCLFGGGWGLMYCRSKLPDTDVCNEILRPALLEPVRRLLSNSGITEQSVIRRPSTLLQKILSQGPTPIQANNTINSILSRLNASASNPNLEINSGLLSSGAEVFDAANQVFVNAVEAGIFDSVPAVIEAIRNSISIATLLGTLGGVVVFPRDEEFERQDARDAQDYLRNANYNPADDRP